LGAEISWKRYTVTQAVKPTEVIKARTRGISGDENPGLRYSNTVILRTDLLLRISSFLESERDEFQMYNKSLGANMITTPNEECLDGHRCEGRLLVGRRKQSENPSEIRKDYTRALRGKFRSSEDKSEGV